MSDESKPGFDPRFSPAFQRGFDPDAPADEARTRVVEAAPPVAPAVAQVRVPAAAPPVFAPETVTVADENAIVPLTQTPQEETPRETASTRNPFLLALGIVAVVLVAAGIWLFVRSGAAFNSREVRSQGDYMSLDATIHTAPFIALLGAATAIGLLFVFAVRWRKRR